MTDVELQCAAQQSATSADQTATEVQLHAFLTRYQVEVNGQLHVPGRFNTGKETPALTECDVFLPENQSGQFKGGEICCPRRELN